MLGRGVKRGYYIHCKDNPLYVIYIDGTSVKIYFMLCGEGHKV